MKTVVATEVAESEYERWLEAMDLTEKITSKTDADDRKPFDDARGTIITAMQRGSLVVDASGRAVFTPQLDDTTPITFREPRGTDLMAMDGAAKKLGDVTKSFHILGSMTEQPPSRFGKMAMRDLRVCQALMVCFLA